MPQVTSRELLQPLDGRVFATDRELHEAVLEIFNQHLSELPPGYYYTQLIEWARRQEWILRTDSGYRVQLTQPGRAG